METKDLIVWKLYNKWMYLWNTEDLYIDWGELSWDWRNVFLKWDSIYDTLDTDILEDNDDMLPAKIIYDWWKDKWKEYILYIRSFELQSWHSVYSLQYQWWRYVKTGTGRKMKILHNFYENDWESIRELIEKFNIHKKSTGYPKEIRYLY